MALDVSGVVAELGDVAVAVSAVGAAGLIVLAGIRSFDLIRDALIVREAAWEAEEYEELRRRRG